MQNKQTTFSESWPRNGTPGKVAKETDTVLNLFGFQTPHLPNSMWVQVPVRHKWLHFF